MNRRGQIWAYSLMLSICLIVLVLGMIPAGQDFVNSAMNNTVGDTIGLDCDNESISNFQKGTCTITDFSTAYVFGGMLLIAVGVIGSRFMFGGSS